MATLHTAAPPTARTLRGIEVENRFFVGMSLLLLATVLVGFAKSYFLAGMVRAPLPNKLIHFHALFFSCWILLLITQATLISASRFDLHRQFGLFGFGLACGMTIVGVMAATDSLRRIKMVGSIDTRTFYAVPLFDILVFAVLVFFAYYWRHDPATHKRLILIASITIVDNVVRALPVMTAMVSVLRGRSREELDAMVRGWDNEKSLGLVLAFLSKRLNALYG